MMPGFPQENIIHLDEYNGEYKSGSEIKAAMVAAFKPEVCAQSCESIKTDWHPNIGGSKGTTSRIRMPQQILLLFASPRIRDPNLAVLVCTAV